MKISNHFGIDSVLLTIQPEDDFRKDTLVIDMDQTVLLIKALQAEVRYLEEAHQQLNKFCDGKEHPSQIQPSGNEKISIPTSIPEEYWNYKCGVCGARVKMISLGMGMKHFQIVFRCGRVAAQRGDRKVEIKECAKG